MKTKITNNNFATIEAGFNNPFGMEISNTPEVRKAVAEYAKSIIKKLHEEKRNKNN